jgi:hypothetical protein
MIAVWQIDNAAYAVGLSERVRTRVENFGRVELRDVDAAALVRSKAVHVALLVAAVPSIVWSADGRLRVVLLAPFLVFWIGGMVEAVAAPGAGTVQKIKRVGKATGAFVLGVVGVMTVMFVFGPPSGHS